MGSGVQKEEVIGLDRMQCRTSDGKEGWVTVVGNQGSKFLEPSNKMKCVKETTITDVLEVKGSTTLRKLKLGEEVEVRDLMSKVADDSQMRRIRIKAKSDGVCGWATVIGSAGGTF